MINEDLIKRLVDVIEDARHPHYPRTCELADEYRMLATGDKLDKRLRRLVQREDEPMFEQRLLHTTHVAPSIWRTLSSPAYKVPAGSAIKKEIHYEDKNRKLELESILQKFYGKDSLEDYFNTRQIDLSLVDPNAFLVLEFNEFDNTKQRAQLYPFEVESKRAVDYKYINRILEYLIVETEIKLKLKSGKERDGKKYTLYLKGQVIDFVEVEEHKMKNDVMYELGDEVFLNANHRSFKVISYEPNGSTHVQAYRVGYMRDQYTSGETYVSMLHPAVPYILKGLDINSELDLSIKFHAKPQKIVLGDPCDGDGCYQGFVQKTQSTCKVCKGSGRRIDDQTAQDVIVVDKPKDKETFIKLSDYTYQNEAPIDILEFMENYCDHLVEHAKRAMYNSDQFTFDRKVRTLGEVNNDMDNVYDTLYPFAMKYAALYKYATYTIAEITNLDAGLTVVVSVDKDFKLKTVNTLMAERKALVDSGGDTLIAKMIDRDIIEIKAGNDKTIYKRYLVKNEVVPFSNKSNTEIALIRASSHIRLIDKIKFDYSDVIFNELEDQYENLYEKNIKEIRKLFDKAANEILNELEPAQVVPDI